MTIYAGESITLRVRGVDGASRGVITDADCVFHLYAPGRDPVGDTSVRENPDGVAAGEFDMASRQYMAVVSTAGWGPGTWTMRAVLSGGANGYFAYDFSVFEVSK